MATGLVGGWLFRREGLRGWRRLRDSVEQGSPPGLAAADGAIGLVAAVALILPGFVTDVLALVVLVAPVRRLVAAGIRGVAERRLSSATVGGLFGPRWVRPARVPRGAAGGPVDDAAVLDGEIVDQAGTG